MQYIIISIIIIIIIIIINYLGVWLRSSFGNNIRAESGCFQRIFQPFV